jgi:TDG/mug DNA glycosylase family protein
VAGPDLARFRGATVPDLLGPDVRLLFVGINPGLLTAAVQAHFARRGNRFYPALYRAGITDRLIDASRGYLDEDRQHLLARGVGITNLVPVATARADELTPEQIRAGGPRLARVVEQCRPHVVAVLGITAYRVAFDLPAAVQGEQPDGLRGARLWVLPNPSGLNAHARLEDLAARFADAATAAGIARYPR